MTRPDTAAATIVRLPDDLRVSTADDVRDELLRHVGGDAAVALDGGDVEWVGTAGLQVLLAFAVECPKFTWHAASQPLRQFARHTGLAGVLRLEATEG
ncbi:MAG: STAS domain-containing protein [Nannocystales bacterium]